jgi:hypothetical protein
VNARPNPGPGHGRADGGREIAFELNGRPFGFETPPPGDPSIRSVFLVGLPKAGSTLLNRMMRPITAAAGLSFVGLQERMFSMGVAPQDIPAAVNAAFAPSGYVFGAFRSLPGGFELPAYAAGRTILLVRDPRDMLTSLYFSLARSHRPPGKAVGGEMAATFEEHRREINSMSIDAFALARAAVVIDQYATVAAKLSAISHQLYRYEDIIFDKASWARDMVAWLGLSVPAAVMESAVDANDLRPAVEDPAQHVRKVVPGDHREKLRAETISELNARLEPILRRYRYL